MGFVCTFKTSRLYILFTLNRTRLHGTLFSPFVGDLIYIYTQLSFNSLLHFYITFHAHCSLLLFFSFSLFLFFSFSLLLFFSLYQTNNSGVTKEDREANFNAWLKEKKDIREEERKLASSGRGSGSEEDLGYGPNGAEIVRDHQGKFFNFFFLFLVHQ